MAMRLREIDGRWVAVCAAVTKPKIGDIYIDDAQAHAIRAKLSLDNLKDGYNVAPVDIEIINLMIREEADKEGAELLETKWGKWTKENSDDCCSD